MSLTAFYETIEASSKLCIRLLSNLCKNDLNKVLVKNLFSIANDCSVNLFDLSKLLAKKQMKYFDVLLDRGHGNILDWVHGNLLDRVHGNILDRVHGNILDRVHGNIL